MEGVMALLRRMIGSLDPDEHDEFNDVQQKLFDDVKSGQISQAAPVFVPREVIGEVNPHTPKKISCRVCGRQKYVDEECKNCGNP